MTSLRPRMGLTFTLPVLALLRRSEDRQVHRDRGDLTICRATPRSFVMATKKTSPTKQPVTVTLRRLGKPVGDIPAGRFILVINPKVFGTVDNWLGGSKAHYATRDAAVAAAPKLGGRVTS